MQDLLGSIRYPANKPTPTLLSTQFASSNLAANYNSSLSDSSLYYDTVTYQTPLLFHPISISNHNAYNSSRSLSAQPAAYRSPSSSTSCSMPPSSAAQPAYPVHKHGIRNGISIPAIHFFWVEVRSIAKSIYADAAYSHRASGCHLMRQKGALCTMRS